MKEVAEPSATAGPTLQSLGVLQTKYHHLSNLLTRLKLNHTVTVYLNGEAIELEGLQPKLTKALRGEIESEMAFIRRVFSEHKVQMVEPQ